MDKFAANPRPADDPLARARLIDQSVRVFVCGLLSFLPLIGLGLAFAAILTFFRATARSTGEWNPANHYMRWGLWFSLISAVLNGALLMWLLLPFLRSLL